MSIAIYRRIWCDGPGSGLVCGSWLGDDLAGETAAELRRRARNAGWLRRAGKDLCSDCVEASNSKKGATS
jgi:hypothetical protein